VVRPARRRPAPVQGVRQGTRPGAGRSPARRDDPALQGHPGERPTTTTNPLRASVASPARDGGFYRVSRRNVAQRTALTRQPPGGTRPGVGGAAWVVQIDRGGGPRRCRRRGGRYRQDEA